MIDAGLTWIGPTAARDPRPGRQVPRGTSPCGPGLPWCRARRTRSGRGRGARLRRRVRAADRDQGGVRWRRARAEGRPRAPRDPRALRLRGPRGRRRVRAGRVLRRALSGQAPARRGPGARRHPRQRDRGRHPGLLAAAPVPEARRGGARAVPDRRAAHQLHEAARRSAGRPATTAPAPSNSWSARTARSPSWRSTPGCRSSTRSPRRPPGSTWCASSSASPTARSSADRRPGAARPRDRVPDQRRGPGPRLPARPRHGHGVRPAAGPGVRIDTGIEAGSVIGGQFDSLLAKLIVDGATRTEALERSRRALDELLVEGMATALPFHRLVVRDPAFAPKTRAVHRSHPVDRDRVRQPVPPFTGGVEAEDGERGSRWSSRSAASGSRSSLPADFAPGAGPRRPRGGPATRKRDGTGLPRPPVTRSRARCRAPS